ncbi:MULTISPECIES: hypothetical protein [unclassified Gilliamella]|jgi:hypothetical protein|uniref:hypothetical protein n=1 Tax=unclassified Gilliamella TaxID=2685620 RepID=UPI00080DBC36|nr:MULTISPECIES: hypothetical protein [Gilliamella]NUF48730.1 hypothetical protein [Gilliamella sp. ESL0250]OCG15993.1 hypothetical protein A9G24_01215 [Gilliamella apicola]
MSLFEQFETDKTKEKDGVPIEYAANANGTIPTFYIARIGGANSKYSLLIKKMTKQYKRQIQMDTLPEEKLIEISIKAFSEGALRGWDNIQDRKGKNIPFSIENACNLFKQLPDLFTDLISQANDIELYKSVQIEEDIKN